MNKTSKQLDNIDTIEMYLQCIAVETARMSWPGSSMTRGKNQILKENSKSAVETFFRDKDKFPMGELWDDPGAIANRYDEWHREITHKLASALDVYIGNQQNKPEAIAAKLINTFMHQLMKIQRFQVLWDHLHLTLDKKVFSSLNRCTLFDCDLETKKIIKKSPYTLEYNEYEKVQKSLWTIIEKMPSDFTEERVLTSRIQLNCWLWTSE